MFDLHYLYRLRECYLFDWGTLVGTSGSGPLQWFEVSCCEAGVFIVPGPCVMQYCHTCIKQMSAVATAPCVAGNILLVQTQQLCSRSRGGCGEGCLKTCRRNCVSWLVVLIDIAFLYSSQSQGSRGVWRKGGGGGRERQRAHTLILITAYSLKRYVVNSLRSVEV
jgi:hypothetical protein